MQPQCVKKLNRFVNFIHCHFELSFQWNRPEIENAGEKSIELNPISDHEKINFLCGLLYTCFKS